MFSLWIRYHSSRAFEKTYWKQTWRSKIFLRSVWKRCYWCTLSDLKLHIKSKHEGVRYPCSHCEYVFTTAGNLKKHIKSKHGEWDIHVIIVTRARIPKIHIENKHEGVRYLFDQCEYVATDWSNLNKHIKITHEGVRYAINASSLPLQPGIWIDILKINIELWDIPVISVNTLPPYPVS